MFLYIDSLFAEGGEPLAQPRRTIPTTLNELYLTALRDHAREAMLLLRGGGGWDPMFDWRFDRRAIRVALYLRERLELTEGDAVAIVAGRRLDWLLVDYAVVGLGAISVVVPDTFRPDQILSALREAKPRAVFLPRSVLDDPAFERSELPGVEAWIDLDDRAGDPETTDFTSVVDLGGTLDTPERAQRFRQQARLTPPGQVAIRHYAIDAEGSTTHTNLTQDEVIEGVERIWSSHAAQEGDLVYVVTDELTLDLRLTLYLLVGDGYSTTASGKPDQAAEDITTLRPHGIVAPSATLWQLIRNAPVEAEPRRGLRRRVGRLMSRVSRARSRERQSWIRRAMGGRTRWIAASTPIDGQLANELRSAIDIDSRSLEFGPTVSELATSGQR